MDFRSKRNPKQCSPISNDFLLHFCSISLLRFHSAFPFRVSRSAFPVPSVQIRLRQSVYFSIGNHPQENVTYCTSKTQKTLNLYSFALQFTTILSIIAIIWIVAFLAILPTAYFTRYVFQSNSNINDFLVACKCVVNTLYNTFIFVFLWVLLRPILQKLENGCGDQKCYHSNTSKINYLNSLLE